MKSTILLVIAFFVVNVPAFAHLGSIKGIVKDNQTNQPILGASVFIKTLKKGAVTDDFGHFYLNNLEPATYEIELSFVGYATEKQTVTVKSDDETVVEFSMKNSSLLLNEIKITAGNPQHQQVISSLDIKLRPINNSQEVLRIIPGLFIGQHAGGGKAEQIFLRGFDLDHGTDIRLTVDGIPINMVSHAHGQGYADAHFIIPELIDKVDFKKGLYDTDKGNFSTAGWVNFKTKTVLDENIVKAELGQFNTRRVMAAVNLLGEKAKAKNQSAYIASEYNFSDAYFENLQNFNRFNLLGKYHSHITEGVSVNLTASTFWSKWNASGQIPDRAVESGLIGFYGSIDPNEGGQTSRTNFNAEVVTATRKNHVWKNQAFFSNYNFELYSNFTFFLNDAINGDQIKQKEGRNLFGYNSSYAINHTLGNKQATTTFGVNYRHDLTQNSELSHTKDRIEVLERLKYGNINEANVAAYVDENIELSDRLTATVGVRFDYFNNQYTDHLEDDVVKKAAASIVSPKLNLYYTADSRVQFYLNMGKGFHSNDTLVVVAQKGLEILPAAYGTDLGVIWKPFPNMVVNAAYWYLWLDQEFVYVGDAGVSEPSGKSVRRGIDVSLRYQLAKNLFFDADANWAKPRAVGAAEGENYLPLAPIFTTMGGLTLKNDKGLSGSLRYRYVSNRPANEDNSIVAKGYFIPDVQLNYTKKKVTIGFSIQNLFNTQWKETQFATESRLKNEANSVNEIHFTSGTPFNIRGQVVYRF